VDDSPGVAIEGRTHGFRVVLVSPHDERWTEQVLHGVDEVLRLRTQQLAPPGPGERVPRSSGLPADLTL
jgi:hypothetical protein